MNISNNKYNININITKKKDYLALHFYNVS